MKDIAIYGAGGFGREVACLINLINKERPTWNLIGFFDDDEDLKGKMISHFGPCHGGFNELNAWDKCLSIVIAVGNPIAISTIVGNIQNKKINYPNIIHPNFVIVDPVTFQIGKGNVIQGGCHASCDVSLGDFNVLNRAVALGHDVNIGSFNSFMPAIRVSGEVKIGNYNFFGVGSIILQQITVGNRIRLGAGSVLMRKPKDGYLYMGNPAKRIDL